MKNMTNEELKKINGGGFGLGALLSAGLVFIIGVIDGLIRLK